MLVRNLTLGWWVAGAILLGAAPSAHAQKIPPPAPDFPHQHVYYYNGPQRVDMLLALDELRVSTGPGSRLSGLAVARLGGANSGQEEMGGSVLVRFGAPVPDASALQNLAVPYRDAGAQAFGVMYKPQKPLRGEAEPIALPNEFSLKLKENVNLDAVLAAYNLTLLREAPGVANAYIVRANGDSVTAGLNAANAIYEDGLAEFATPLVQRHRVTRLIPNDPQFPSQWHLRNTDQFGTATTAGVDVNVINVWNNYTGAGVNIAITDTGVEVAHSDLSANARTDIDIDINGGDGDPTPSFDGHGTNCAGIAAARGNNGIGVTGAAFEAGIVGIRLIEGFPTDADEAQAMEHQATPANANNRVHINSNSWGPFDDADRKETYGPLTNAALTNGVNNGRGGNGIIYVWAAGNGRGNDDNVNYDGYASDRRTIAVGATNGNGSFSWYSEPGASMLVNAPSSHTDIGTTTTHIGNSYISDFGGTSSSAPLAAGVIALILEANPNIGWREVQHILVDTSTKNDLGGGSWILNGSGRNFSHNYGYGRVNAQAAVNSALEWGNLPTVETLSAGETETVAIPDNTPVGITRTVNISDPAGDFIIEHVEVGFAAQHTWRGDLRVALTSPSGTQSVLADVHGDSGDNYFWKFTSVAHWGESAAGIWALNVSDRFPTDTGSLTGWNITLYGYRPDRNTVWVDGDHAGFEMGEQGRPFVLFNDAVTQANGGATIKLKASNIPGSGTFNKNLRLEAVGGTARIGL